MSDFWNLSDGEDIKNDTSGSFEMGGGKIELIPDRTSVLAAIDEAKWDKDQQGNRYITLRWSVLRPEELDNRKVFLKLWVADADPRAKDPIKKRDKAKRMLAAIDSNAGGKLLSSGKEPTDEMLTTCLTNKPMVIRVMVWDRQDRATNQMVRGNWVGAVAPKTDPITSSAELDAATNQMKAEQQQSSQMRTSARTLDDEIPF